MTGLQQAILLGMLGGGGVALVVAGCSAGRVDLGRLLAQLEATPDPGGGPPGRTLPPPAGWLDRLNTRIADVDLELVGETRERFLLIRVGFALAGMLFLPALVLVLTLTGVPVPIVATVGSSVAGAVVGWLFPPALVRAQAAQARRTFRRALCSYFDLVALERQADRGPVEVLEHPTTLGGSWAFTRLRVEMDRARQLGQPPWQALRVLADRVGVDDLDDLGSILTLSHEEGARSHEEGASIVESLSAKAASMRQRLLAEDLAAAHEQNRQLVLPLSMLGMTIMLFLVFPGLYVLTSS